VSQVFIKLTRRKTFTSFYELSWIIQRSHHAVFGIAILRLKRMEQFDGKSSF